MDEVLIGHIQLDLASLIQEAEKVAGEWNGDESGQKEWDAEEALEIVDKAKELQELLNVYTNKD